MNPVTAYYVNMESHQHNHGKCVSQCFISQPILFRTLAYHHLFQSEAKLAKLHILIYGRLFNWGIN